LYVLGARLKILHDFTGSAQSLLEQMAKFKGDPLANPGTESSFSAFLNDAKMQEILTDPNAQEQAMERIVTDQSIGVEKLQYRVMRTLAGLESIANYLAPVPGRKNLLWVSAAFPSVVSTDVRTGTGSPTTFAHLADKAARAIANAGVAVYPIDARGVMVDPMYRAKVTSADYLMGQVVGLSRSRGARRGPRASFTSPDPLVYGDRDETVAHHDVMKDLAKRTGGKAFYSSNDAAQSIREAMQDGEGTYLLGYYPEGYSDDGKFRRLEVSVEKAGLRAKHREGYFADSSQPVRDQREREAMWDLMVAPLELSAVPMAVQCEAAEQGVKVSMRFDVAAVTLRQQGEAWLGELEIVLLYQDVKGASKGGAEQKLPLKLSNEDRRAAMEAGLNYQLMLPRVAGATSLLVGVRDVPSGRVGTMKVTPP